MEDWKLKARTVVKLYRTRSVSLYLDFLLPTQFAPLSESSRCGTFAPWNFRSWYFPIQDGAKVRSRIGFARFLATKYGRVLSISDVRQGQYDAISCVCVCVFRSIVTMAVSLAITEIFSVKEWPDLEMWVWVCSRSLKKAQFSRPSDHV